MKYTGKWWDNPKRGEDERRVAYGVAQVLGWLIILIVIINLLIM